MQAAITLADHLDGEAILAMHAALMADEPRHTVGAWRRQQVWIGGTNYGPHLADFVPPHHIGCRPRWPTWSPSCAATTSRY